MNPEHLREDLKQELFLVLCEKSDTFIEDLHKKNQLKFYATRIILNMIASNTSPFYKKFRGFVNEIKHEDAAPVYGINKHLLYDEFTPQQKEVNYTNLVNAVNAAIEKLPHYDREIFKDYVAKGSAGKMIKEMVALTGSYIPKRSILATVKSVKNFIKEEVKKSV